jgi:phosphate starvation-inducible membrane PsiE
MHKIFEKLKEEFSAIRPPTIFFFVALHLVTCIRVLIAKGSHFEPLSTMSIAVASLILGKAVLIADMLPAINRYPHKPLAISHGRR